MADPSPEPDAIPVRDANSDATRTDPDRGSPPDTPRWVKMFGIIVLFATVVLLIYLQTLDKLATAAAQTTFSSIDFGGHHGGASPVVHASIALLLLITCVVLSVYKPWGKTQYGKRK